MVYATILYYLFNSDFKTEGRCVIGLSFLINNPLVIILMAVIIINNCSPVLNSFCLPGFSSSLLPHPPLGFSALTTYLSCSKFPRTESDLWNLLLPHPFQIWVNCFLGTLLYHHPGTLFCDSLEWTPFHRSCVFFLKSLPLFAGNTSPVTS